MERIRWVAVSGLLVLAGCGGGDSPASPSGVTTLQVVDLQVGTGAEAVVGSVATVEYAGWLYELGGPDNKGALFDSSARQGRPFTFTVGAGQVIRGWDQGVPGMRVGGIRRLVIPPDLAYGSRGQGAIPPNATLVFEVQLVAVQ